MDLKVRFSNISMHKLVLSEKDCKVGRETGSKLDMRNEIDSLGSGPEQTERQNTMMINLLKRRAESHLISPRASHFIYLHRQPQRGEKRCFSHVTTDIIR